MRAFIVVVTALLAGCTTPTLENPDAPRSDAHVALADAESFFDAASSTTEDAPLEAPTLSPDAPVSGDAWMSSAGRACLFHSQCDDGQLCESGGVGSTKRCTVSDRPRGPGTFESECANNDECADGFCWSSGYPGVGQRCSQSCETNAECGTVLNTCRGYARTEFRFCDHRTM